MLKIKRPLIKKLKWGAAGCGRYTEHSFLPAVKVLSKSVCSSVFSKTPSRAKFIADKFGIRNSFSNYDEFLKSDINAVYVSGPNSEHYDHVIKAAKAGKHILCEKPIALNSVEAEEMVKVCEENNVLLAVNYVYRFNPLVIKTRELIKNQMIGKIVSINLNFNIDLPPGDNFRFKKAQSGGGAFRDLGTHMIDLLRYFGGEISDITGVIDQIIYKSEVDDFAAAIVKFSESGYGLMNVSYNNKKAFNHIEILGHKGAISIDNFIGQKYASSRLTILIDGEAKKTFRKRGSRNLYMLRSVQSSFLKNQQPLVTGYDGLINLRLMEQLEEKCNSGKS